MRLRLVVGGMRMLLVGCWMRVLQRTQLDVNNYFSSKEFCLRASVIVSLRLLLICRGAPGRRSRKTSGFHQKFEGVACGVGGSRVFN
jgi:hypothetical protein